ncbi:hypothetical protein K2Y11_14350 [bacterium]|nr:hypothetical protein [bacterium]
MIWKWTKGLAGVVLISSTLSGCSPATQSTSSPANAKTPDSISNKESETTSTEGLAELSEADRALATKQKLCPVSGEPLGSMGAPLQVQVKDQSVWICCDGCEGRLKKDPDKYLAKLK